MVKEEEEKQGSERDLHDKNEDWRKIKDKGRGRKQMKRENQQI